jgi:hypothetical protein
MNLQPIPDARRTLCTSAVEALNLARQTEQVVRVLLCPDEGGSYRIAVGPGGEWVNEDDERNAAAREVTSPGYPGPCPDGMGWSEWLAFNNVD